MPRIHAVLLAVLLLSAVALGGCGTIYESAMDPRDIGTQTDDAQIDLAVNKALLDDENVKVMDIDPYVFYGRVYLVGEYETDAQRARAIELAKGVEGVRSVKAHLLPKKEVAGCGLSDRVAMKARIRKDLIAAEDLHSTNVEVAVVQCNVVLLGIMDTSSEIDKAIDIARKVQNVRSVTSYLSSTLGK